MPGKGQPHVKTTRPVAVLLGVALVVILVVFGLLVWDASAAKALSPLYDRLTSGLGQVANVFRQAALAP